jgi:hypothetical protein
MKRQDFADFCREYRRRNTRWMLAALVFLFVWMSVLFTYGSEFLDEYQPEWFFVAAAIPIVVLLGMVGVAFSRMPKCPHCGTRLLGPLIATAIASGNCGYCGRSLED